MSALETKNSGFFSGRLDRLVNMEGDPNLKEIRKRAFASFSSMPFLDGGEVRFDGDLREMPVSRFRESFQPYVEGYSPAGKPCGIAPIGDFAGSLDAELMTPATGFGGYCLAFFEKGMYVECGSSADKGFIRIDSGPGVSLEPVYIKVPAGASSVLFLSLNGDAGSLGLDAIRAEVCEGSALKLFIHSRGGGARFVDMSARLARDSRAEVFVLRQEGGDFVYRSLVAVKEENARFTENTLASLKGRERADFRSAVIQNARNAEARVDVRAITRDFSKVGLNGLIRVEKTAAKSRSRYSGHCLKLSSDSRAHVEPNLEIEALDIEASHAASVSPPDEEKLFYLGARGMSPAEAEKEVCLGFLASLLRENPEISALVEENI